MFQFKAMAARKVFGDGDLTDFGRRLRDAYKAAGYTQSSFGRAMGVSTGQMTRWLYEKLQHGLNFDVVDRIELLTGVRIQWLASGKLPANVPVVTPVEQAIEQARSRGIPTDVIFQSLRWFEGAKWDSSGWYRVFLAANDRAMRDTKWREKVLCQVKMAPDNDDDRSKTARLKSGEFTSEEAIRHLAG